MKSIEALDLGIAGNGKIYRNLSVRHLVEEALKKTYSPYLKQDYQKHLKRLKKDLREYCYYRGFNYKEIIGE